MSPSRHARPGRESFLIVRSLALRLPAGYRIDHHDHAWGQVIFAPRGTIGVEATDRYWLVPPHRALWMPAGVRHRIVTIGETWMRTVYLRQDSIAPGSATVRVLGVSPLLRELLLEVVRRGALDEGLEGDVALARVLHGQLSAAPGFGVALPMPVDDRARRVAACVLDCPGADTSLGSLARAAGAGARTIERLFAAETGLSFGRWRSQARLQHAVCRLAEGMTVTRVAFECGYESTSAFVAMFRRMLGVPPGEYVRRSRMPS